MTSPGWYLRRLSRMGPAEIVGRAGDTLRRRRWRRVLTEPVRQTWRADRSAPPVLPAGTLDRVPADAAARLTATAEELMSGKAEYFGVWRDDLVAPDWSFDPKTGRSAPADAYAFDIAYRSEDTVGDIKQLWEPSRHQHLTVLAAAYALTGEDRYAERVAEHLRSWWAANPPLRGVHWVSGIELGIRLISWVWVRRLLDGWPGAPALFEDNPVALHQVWHHQRWLAGFRSRGSSANNHVIAEAAGQVAASAAFDWFPESGTWGPEALRVLDEQLRRNTFGSGLNRELATEYHGLVLELGLAAALEAHAGGIAVPDSTWLVLLRMCDALAAVVDVRLRPPRQGDADDGHGLVLDGAGTDRWGSLLATGAALFGRRDWWPEVPGTDVRTPLLAAFAGGVAVEAARPERRAAHFADAGLTVLRASTPDGELWCRCDGGPHGFLSIAAHAHADALSVEIRHDGVDILADPGTYCYHGQPEWRSYFRSTLAHNTLELHGADQSSSGGPFLWTRHARTTVLAAEPTRWSAEHDGYALGVQPAIHRRTVDLDAERREYRIHDEVHTQGRHPARLAFHLGPEVTATLDGHTVRLTWTTAQGERGAVLELPAELSWRAHRGETDPPLGWYSSGFGRIEPATTLVGTGMTGVFTTLLRFD
ncbi:alginate lyase family protein [Actinophytocola gossypii]|uniref:Alginate lyase family protein n=1 Tax=Actinophytocola gossypii TaxID=2812003 RepID=A0ABT2JCZ5_9PSEU|nr:alginate lyase family protein [Actinophytocola gossypii]MCT2585742.1 alginate lyase family protein [Actinophytocola gossypii]